MTIETNAFGKLSDGTTCYLYTCTNSHGLVVKMTNYGASVVSVETPDRDGQTANVNVGFADLDGYLQPHPCFGATVGRCCNRVAKGQFELDGQQYTLATNCGNDHLHGGHVGFDKHVWDAKELDTGDAAGVKFSRLSPDGEEGYPGNLQVTASYTLTQSDELVVEFTAVADKPTPVNLTNHNYWNLAGVDTGTILEHELTIEADQYLLLDDDLIPTGALASVEGTPLDFRSPERIGARIGQIETDPVGYDYCYALRSQDGALSLAAKAKDPASGRVMEVLTTQPGMQFYTGNFLDGSEACAGHRQHDAFCLETQHYPDAPNHSSFPNVILRPGKMFHQTTVHRFRVE